MSAKNKITSRLNPLGTLHYAFGGLTLFYLCFFAITKFRLGAAISWCEANSAGGEEISGAMAMAVGSLMLITYFAMVLAVAFILGGLAISLLISGWMLRHRTWRIFSLFVAVLNCLAISGAFLFSGIFQKTFFALLFALGVCAFFTLGQKSVKDLYKKP